MKDNYSFISILSQQQNPTIVLPQSFPLLSFLYINPNPRSKTSFPFLSNFLPSFFFFQFNFPHFPSPYSPPPYSPIFSLPSSSFNLTSPTSLPPTPLPLPLQFSPLLLPLSISYIPNHRPSRGQNRIIFQHHSTLPFPLLSSPLLSNFLSFFLLQFSIFPNHRPSKGHNRITFRHNLSTQTWNSPFSIIPFMLLL